MPTARRACRLTYGLRFREFIPPDVGGPLTRQALAAGDINVAPLYVKEGAIRAPHRLVCQAHLSHPADGA